VAGAILVAVATVAVTPAVAGAGSAGLASGSLTGGGSSGQSSTAPSGTVISPDATPPLAPFQGHGSIGEAYELGATPGTHLTLLNGAGAVAGSGTADAYGSLIIRNLPTGSGYRFRTETTPSRTTASFAVLGTDSTPAAGFYADQHLHAGLNYLTMRDGIQLSATVRLPVGKTMADGPFPTVIEYSGYDVAGPDDLVTALLSSLGGNSKALNDPLLPSTATAVGSAITPLLGFATVSLQMRGTGCSGGAFDLFGLPSDYDGYDAVQIVGSQPWVAHHKVGMVGISFSGLSQFMVAGTRPPDLAAIAPMSPTNDLYATGYPGGILNNGFAASWIAERVSDARPAPEGGQPWADAEIEQGDRQCLANQDLRLQTQNVATLMGSDSTRDPALFDQRSDQQWATKVDVPVFLVGALQDEQTGPQWPALINALSGDKDVFVTMINGAHVDSLGPASLTRWAEFLDLFVAQQLPHLPAIADALSGQLYQQIANAPAEPLPPLRFTDAPSVAAAKADFISQDPRVRVLMDNGNGSAGPGAMQPTWEVDLPSWPAPKAVVTTLHLGAGGALSAAAPSKVSTTSFRPDASLRPVTSLPSNGNAWAPTPDYDWTPVTGSGGLGFVSAPLTKDVTVVGPASLDLRLASTATDTDLQVTVSEVRPDGQEMYVTSGFLRAGFRALDASASTALAPVPTYRKNQPLTPGTMTTVRIPIDPIAYAFRTGSRIRITISAPGGDRPVWAFATPPTGGKVVDTVALGGTGGSTLVLPVLDGVVPGDAQPPCPSLRGEPCRAYVPAGNGG
jgi:predicted acyl esterase